jgi:excisionase family DNA binding protein
MTSTKEWDVAVTLDVALPDGDALGAILDALPSGSAVGRSAWSDHLTVQVTAFAPDVRAAAATGVLFAEHAWRAMAGTVEVPDVLGLEVLTPEETERRSARSEEPLELVSVTEAADMLGVTPGRIRQRAAAGELGAIKVGDAGWAFPRDLVERETKK